MNREKKAVITAIEKLINKYGYDKTRLIINKYFALMRERKNTKEIIIRRKKELKELKKSLEK